MEVNDKDSIGNLLSVSITQQHIFELRVFSGFDCMLSAAKSLAIYTLDANETKKVLCLLDLANKISFKKARLLYSVVFQ